MNPRNIEYKSKTKADRSNARKKEVKALIAAGHTRSVAINKAKQRIK